MVQCLYYCEEVGQGGISIADVRRISFYNLFILWCSASTIARRMAARAESLLLMWGALVSMIYLFYGAVPLLLRGGSWPRWNLYCRCEAHWFLWLVYSMVQCFYYCEEDGGQGGISIAAVRRIGFYDLFILWCSASTIERRREARAESQLLTWGALVSMTFLFYGAVPLLLRGGGRPRRNLYLWCEAHWFLWHAYSMVQCLYYARRMAAMVESLLLTWGALVSITCLFYGAVPLLLRGGSRPGRNLYWWLRSVILIGFYDLFILWRSASTIARRKSARAESLFLMWGALVSMTCLFYGAVPLLLRGGWLPWWNLYFWREVHWFLYLVCSMVQCLYYCEEEVGQGGISIADVRRNYNHSKVTNDFISKLADQIRSQETDCSIWSSYWLCAVVFKVKLEQILIC